MSRMTWNWKHTGSKNTVFKRIQAWMRREGWTKVRVIGETQGGGMVLKGSMR